MKVATTAYLTKVIRRAQTTAVATKVLDNQVAATIHQKRAPVERLMDRTHKARPAPTKMTQTLERLTNPTPVVQKALTPTMVLVATRVMAERTKKAPATLR